MTTEAKCECGSDDFNARNLAQGERRVPHALNCPKHTNAEAPRVGSWDGFGEKPHPETWPAPAPEPEDGECVGAIGCLRYSNEGHKKGCPRHNIEIIRAKHKAPYPKQGSEEPIDWKAAAASSESWAKGRPLPHDLKCTPAQETLARAYLAIRAQLAEKEREIASAREEIAKLKNLCEQSRSCLADGSQLRPTDREWLISNLDRAILAARKGESR